MALDEGGLLGLELIPAVLVLLVLRGVRVAPGLAALGSKTDLFVLGEDHAGHLAARLQDLLLEQPHAALVLQPDRLDLLRRLAPDLKHLPLDLLLHPFLLPFN